jgi:hypothetical protein
VSEDHEDRLVSMLVYVGVFFIAGMLLGMYMGARDLSLFEKEERAFVRSCKVRGGVPTKYLEVGDRACVGARERLGEKP